MGIQDLPSGWGVDDAPPPSHKVITKALFTGATKGMTGLSCRYLAELIINLPHVRRQDTNSAYMVVVITSAVLILSEVLTR